MSYRTGKDPSQQVAGKTFQSKRKPATDYEEAQEAFLKNYERLKAERLARQAAKSEDKTRR